MASSTPILEVAEAIVRNIDDYFTAVLLGMTCRTFRDLVFRDSILNPLFDEIELKRPRNTLQPQTLDGFCPDAVLQEKNLRAFPIERPYLLYIAIVPMFKPWPRKLKSGRITVSRWVLFFSPKFCCVRRFNDLLPCYGCRKIKSVKRRKFFYDQLHDEYYVDGCFRGMRRCIDCLVAEMEKHDPHFDEVGNNDPQPYLIDMPVPARGFRLHCQACGKYEWARKRPKKAQESKKVCSACFNNASEASALAICGS